MGAIGLSGFRPELADDLSHYLKEAGAGEKRFDVMVKGARCAGCIAKIERGVKAVPGVRDGRLNLSTGKLVVTGRKIQPETILRYVRDLGYDAQPFDAGEMLDAGDREGRFLLRCLAVAGFATVFTMGLTDAIWYGGDLGTEARRNFFWLAGAIAIPATLYSAQPFFQAAWRSIRAARAGMDVPISLALLLSLGMSIYQTATDGAHTYFDASVMLTFLLLVGRYLDFRLRDRARGAARHLLAMQSQLARRIAPDGTLENVAKASLVAMMAGSDFIKTSSGKEGVNANLPVSLVMVRAIRDYHQATGVKVGYKPAGGISTAKDALEYLSLIKEELGDEWLTPDLFRFGASSLLTDIERQLEHCANGFYSASYRHPMP